MQPFMINKVVVTITKALNTIRLIAPLNSNNLMYSSTLEVKLKILRES